jgi:hypothetical protein
LQPARSVQRAGCLHFQCRGGSLAAALNRIDRPARLADNPFAVSFFMASRECCGRVIDGMQTRRRQPESERVFSKRSRRPTELTAAAAFF